MKHFIFSNKKKYFFLLLLIFSSFSALLCQAQCSVCSAQVESNAHEGKDQARGLNTGILYLMTAPYLLIAGAGFLWYKKYKKKNVIVDVKDDDIFLN